MTAVPGGRTGAVRDADVVRLDLADPFGLHDAVAESAVKPTVGGRIGGLARLWAIRVVAVLPVPLAIVLTVVALADAPHPPATIGAVVLWLWLFGFVAHQLRLFSPTVSPEVGIGQAKATTSSVLVVGAGPVGLTVVKECAEAGLQVEAFERMDGPGGVFRYQEEFDGGVWRSCTLTSSPFVTAYADFPPEDDDFHHLSHSAYKDYLEGYVDHFGFRERLHFRHTVLNVAPDGDEGWAATVRNDLTGEEMTRQYDRVVVCAGLNLQPKAVDLPGQDSFTGTIRHVASYKGPDGLDGKRIVIVGSGESGVDIAAEIAGVAQECHLAIPRGKFVIPRINGDNGIANDYDTNRLRYSVPVAVRGAYLLFKDRLAWLLGRQDPAGAVRSRLMSLAESGPFSQTATKNDDFVEHVLAGRLCVRSRVVGFEGGSVRFADGSLAEADEVIFAHGYSPTFPFLDLPEGVAHRHPGLLYRRMFMPELGDRLAFCGFARPAIGAIPPTGELQARLFALVATGERILPDQATMRNEVLTMLQDSHDMFPANVQPGVVISWIPYLDHIAGLIGCRPNGRALLRRPGLLWRVMRGPINGAMYRLHGPGASPEAERTLRRIQGTHPLWELLTHLGMHFWTWPYAQLHPRAEWRTHNTVL